MCDVGQEERVSHSAWSLVVVVVVVSTEYSGLRDFGFVNDTKAF
jgi:hypothetical protein